MKKRGRVLVGLSGGVDSAVATKLLKDEGYEVIGIFLKIWDEKDPHCPASIDAKDARMTAEKLKIPFYAYDFSEEYRKQVFEYFLEEHRALRTPNADILCNKYIKFGSFLEKAKELSADFIATGHYAKKIWNEKTKNFELHIPADKNKDQTYFLYALTQSQLSQALFPLENMNKKVVRSLARQEGFAIAEKKDSVGICMVGERNYREFLEKYLPHAPGDMIDLETGKKIGTHKGLAFYTIGQRRDLLIGGVRGAKESPWFVVKKDEKENRLFVSQDEENLMKKELIAKNLTWISGILPSDTFECQARIRYRSEPAPCSVQYHPKEDANPSKNSEYIQVSFHSPVRAITPGQSVVFYQGTKVLGGGIIQ